MAISYPLSFPDTDFRAARISLASNTMVIQSPLSKVMTTLERDGALWIGQFTVVAKARASAAAWTAFFTALRGQVGTFYGYDPLATSPRGSAPGSPIVKGSSQTGNTLNTDGWGLNESDVLLAGDYIEVNSDFHMVVQDASSDGVGTGEATISIEPKLRASPSDNAVITTSAPKVIMRLISSVVAWDEDVAGFYGFTFTGIEVLA